MSKTWKEALAEKIAALTEKDWYAIPAARPGDGAYGTKVAYIDVETGVLPFAEIQHLIGTVSDKDVADVAGGRLLLWNSRCNKGETTSVTTFALRDRPWNDFLSPEGEWKPCVDAMGRSPYALADFDLIP